MEDRDWLGEFLRRRREALSPVEAGFPSLRRRRTPGLRREEVAALANVSSTYYERLERARGPRPSAAVLSGIAAALRLSETEKAHLFRLAGHLAPPWDPQPEPVDPGLAYLLTAISGTTPAFVTDDLGTVLAQNWLNVTLFGQFADRPGIEANLVWHWFTSPSWRDRLDPPEQQEQTGMAYVSDLRAVTAQRGRDRTAGDLVERLGEASAEFRAMWGRHTVATPHCSTKVVHDERVGRLDLDCEIVTGATTRQRMLTLQPVAGTPTAERIAALRAHRAPAHDHDVLLGPGNR